MGKFSTASFVATFPFLAEAVSPAFYSDDSKANGHFLKRLNGGESLSIQAVYTAFEEGKLMLTNSPELLAECEKLLPNYGWKRDVLVCAYLTGRLAHIDKFGLCRTGGKTVSALDSGKHGPHTALKEKIHAILVDDKIPAARNEAQIYGERYVDGKRKRATPADAANVAASSQATPAERALAAAILSDDRIPAFFDDTGKLVYGLPSPEMVDAPRVQELAEEHGKLKADQDAIAATVGTLKKELTKKKLAAAKREQFKAQVIELENQLKGIALKLTRIENDPLFKKVG